MDSTHITVLAAPDGDRIGGDTAAAVGGVLLEDGLDLHIAVRHGELVVLDGHAAADDLPLLEVIALARRGGQVDFRTDLGFSFSSFFHLFKILSLHGLH